MDTETNQTFLPQIIEKKLELGLSGSTISLKDFEIASGKTASELSEVISEKICSLPAVRAQAVWKALDEESRFELAYPDNGTFNLDLVEKLNLRGNTLQQAFVAIHARSIFELDAAPLSTPTYINAFTTIQSELLAICKQLLSAKADGKDRLTEFLNGFETDFLATVVRHEIARYYIDEEGAQFDFDMMENETGGTEYIEQETDIDDSDYDIENYQQPDQLEEFNNTFLNGGTVPPCLELTSWIQQYAPNVFCTILNFLNFFVRQRGVPAWERPNPTEEEENELNAKEIELRNIRDEDRFSSGLATAFRERASGELVSVDSEKEFRRLIRVYCITSPLKNNFLKVGQQEFQAQGKIIATVLRESGKETGNIQTFDQLRKAAWDAVGFSSLNLWVYKQHNPQRLITSSGKRWLFDEMKLLGNGAFGPDAIFFEGIEKSKNLVQRLYGWLSLVKIFWSIADQKRRFTDLATIKNDTLYWDENITCCTLIFQLVLETDKLFFSLEDVGRFCALTRDAEWVDAMKLSFRDLSEHHNAVSAVPIFEEYISYLSITGTNMFRIANEVLLSTKAERKLVAAVKELGEEHQNMFLVSLGNKRKDEDQVKEEIGFHFAFKLATLLPQIGAAHRNEAEKYLNYLIAETSVSNYIDLSKFEIDPEKFTE